VPGAPSEWMRKELISGRVLHMDPCINKYSYSSFNTSAGLLLAALRI